MTYSLKQIDGIRMQEGKDFEMDLENWIMGHWILGRSGIGKCWTFWGTFREGELEWEWEGEFSIDYVEFGYEIFRELQKIGYFV